MSIVAFNAVLNDKTCETSPFPPDSSYFQTISLDVYDLGRAIKSILSILSLFRYYHLWHVPPKSWKEENSHFLKNKNSFNGNFSSYLKRRTWRLGSQVSGLYFNIVMFVRTNTFVDWTLIGDWWFKLRLRYALNNLTSHDFACHNWVIVSGHNDNRTLLIEEIKSNEGKKVPRPMPFNGTLSLLFLFLESHRHIHFDEINTRTLTSVLNIKKSKV